MVFLISLAVLFLILFQVINTCRCFSQNLAAAKASNLTYVVVPFFSHHWWVRLTHWMFVPWLRKSLPQCWTHPWLDLVSPEWPWEQLYGPYQSLGVNTFITVSPWGNLIFTADAEVINQITTRKNDFPKPTFMYGPVDIFGKNVLSTEGHMWRKHRKIAGHFFSERTNRLVWAESLHETQRMMNSWMQPVEIESRTIGSLADDTMRLSLHVISWAGFGRRLAWPGIDDAETEDEGDAGSTRTSKDALAGQDTSARHRMRYTVALKTLLHNVVYLLVLPLWLLSKLISFFIYSLKTENFAEYLPFTHTQLVYQSYIEWGMYMSEMFNGKKAQMLAREDNGDVDLMGALVKGAGVISETVSAPPVKASHSASPSQAATMTEDEVIGNAFVFILAGHETTANTIFFACLFLALAIPSQRQLQDDLDVIFQDRGISEWHYERDHSKLSCSMAGAVLNEVLRLVPPVYMIPKWVAAGPPQRILVDGKECFLPSETVIELSAVGVQRNPKYWPTAQPYDPRLPIHPTSNVDNDLEEFKPERWLVNKIKDPKIFPFFHVSGCGSQPKSTEIPNFKTTTETASELFKPPKGAYIPFSEGHRMCLGSRFAQVEILAVVAVIFKTYSIELAVDEWASDGEIEKMTDEEKQVTWGKAKAKAMDLMRNGMAMNITNHIRKGVVPFRFVKRGNERFH